MPNNQQKKERNAFVISVALHLILFGLLILSSLYHTVEIMGGGEGEGDAMGAVMVDTGTAAQEWGRIQQQRKGQTDLAKKPEPIVEEKEIAQPQNDTREQERLQQEHLQEEARRQQEIERQKQEELAKQQREKARQEALEKQQKEAEEAKAKQAAEAAKLKAEAEAKQLATA